MTRGSSVLDRQTFDAVERNQLFVKTKLCKFNLRGMCAKGPECPFAHGQGELRDLPDLRRTKLCAEYIQTGDCTKSNCTFAHNKGELRTAGKVHRSKRQEEWWGTAAIEPQWTSMLNSEDETVDSEGSLDYGYCGSVFDSPDAMAMFGPGWGVGPGGYLDMGCLDSPASMTGMPYSGSPLIDASGLSVDGRGLSVDGSAFNTMEGEPAYVSLAPSSTASSPLADLWEQAAFGESVGMDPSNGVWTVNSALKSVLSD